MSSSRTCSLNPLSCSVLPDWDDIHDGIRHIDGRGQFDRSLQRNDFHGLLDGIKILSGVVHVLRRNHWIYVLFLFAGDGEMAITERQIHQIIDVAVLLDQNIASGDAQIRDPLLPHIQAHLLL